MNEKRRVLEAVNAAAGEAEIDWKLAFLKVMRMFQPWDRADLEEFIGESVQDDREAAARFMEDNERDTRLETALREEVAALAEVFDVALQEFSPSTLGALSRAAERMVDIYEYASAETAQVLIEGELPAIEASWRKRVEEAKQDPGFPECPLRADIERHASQIRGAQIPDEAMPIEAFLEETGIIYRLCLSLNLCFQVWKAEMPTKKRTRELEQSAEEAFNAFLHGRRSPGPGAGE